MGAISKHDDPWQAKATSAAVAAARKIANACPGLPAATPIGELSDTQWGWICTAVIFAWVRTRCEQAIAEGFDQEDAVRITGLEPPPRDVAVIRSILPTLANQAGIDWSRDVLEGHHAEIFAARVAADQQKRDHAGP
jgi:hypothetical protein